MQSLTLAHVAMPALLLLSACGEQKNTASSETPVRVVTQIVHYQTTPVTEEAVGTIRAALRASVAAKISASIERMNAVPGQVVTAGFVLATLSAQEIRARREQAAAMQEQAQQDFARVKQLFDQKTVSQREYEAALSKLRTAKALLDEADAMLTYADIRAPFNGLVTRKLMDQGDLATPGKPLLELENPDLLRLEAEVPEAAISRIALRDQHAVSIDAALVRTNATVSEIAPSANPVSRTFLVKLDLPANASLHPGQFGRVMVAVGERQVLQVPTAAFVARGQLEYVFVVRDGHAAMRIVRTAARTADAVEVVAGLDDGDTVVISGVAALRDGQAVAK